MHSLGKMGKENEGVIRLSPGSWLLYRCVCMHVCLCFCGIVYLLCVLMSVCCHRTRQGVGRSHLCLCWLVIVGQWAVGNSSLYHRTARCQQIPFVFVLIGHCGTVSCRQFQSTSQDTARCQWIPVVFVLIGHCGTVSCRQFQSTSQDSVVSGDPICVCVDWSLWDSERLAIPVYITGQRGVSRSHLCLCWLVVVGQRAVGNSSLRRWRPFSSQSEPQQPRWPAW